MDSGEKCSVQSLSRGIFGLEMAVLCGGVKSSDLADRLSINRSSAYRLLTTMEQLGYLSQDHATKHFYPNYEKIASLMPSAWSWIQTAEPIMFKLCQSTGCRVNIGTIEYGEVIYARCLCPANYLPNASEFIHPGARRPTYVTALGKAILAFQSNSENIDSYLRQDLIRPDKRYPLDAKALMEHLIQIRKTHYAIDDKELLHNIRCIAAPIFDATNTVTGAIGISADSSLITMQLLPELAQQVIAAAEQISTILVTAGYDTLQDNHSRIQP